MILEILGWKMNLRMDIKKRFGGFNTTVALFSSNPIEEIDANEGAFVSCQDVLFQPSILLKSQEALHTEMVNDFDRAHETFMEKLEDDMDVTHTISSILE